MNAATALLRWSLILLVVLSVGGVLTAAAQEETAEITPPATETPTPDITTDPTAEATAEPTAEPTLQPTTPPTQEPTPQPVPTTEETELALVVTTLCEPTGVVFEISNAGADMHEPLTYELISAVGLPEPEPIATDEPEAPAEDAALVEDAPPADDAVPAEDAPPADIIETPAATPEPEPPVDALPTLLLAAGETVRIEAGFGAPVLSLNDALYGLDGGCAEPAAPPALTITSECVFETGVTFTVANNGGPMTEALDYTLTAGEAADVSGSLLLAADESVAIAAGYGQPVLTAGDLIAQPEAVCLAPAVVQGVVFADADGDGLRGETETGIAGVTLRLSDPAGFALEAVTAADGSYAFAGLPGAHYTLTVDTTTLSVDYHYAAGEPSAEVEAYPGETHEVDFAFQPAPSATISGAVWLDLANYGVRDAGEPGITGAQVQLIDASGALVASAEVDAATGAYTFGPVLAGEYQVRLDAATLFTPNAPSFDPDGLLDFATDLTVTTGAALTGVDFGVAGAY